MSQCGKMREQFMFICAMECIFLLNIVSKEKNQPEAVLIRALIGASGPGKATKLLNINKSLNGQSIINNPKICLFDDNREYRFDAKKSLCSR